jgi:hypothetical protein
MLLPRIPLPPLEVFAFRKIWKMTVPSKVTAFAWKLFLDHIPTRENLCRRGIMQQADARCVVCDRLGESALHLFMHCDFVVVIWYTVCRWLGVIIPLPANVIMSYGMLVDSERNAKIRKGYYIVWLALVWVLWRCHNDRIFNNVVGTVADVIDQIHRLS